MRLEWSSRRIDEVKGREGRKEGRRALGSDMKKEGRKEGKNMNI